MESTKGGHFFARPGRFIIICYVIILVPSTLILMTALASVTGLSWIDALFTATSALTVTGLSVVDTGQHFTTAGHIWLILLMQLGGLGQMTVSMLILLIFGYKISIREQALVREELNQHPVLDMRHLIKSIAIFALAVEAIGTLILCLKWVPELGWVKGFDCALFHAISAFNNAGFGLYSDSMERYYDSPLIALTLPALFIIGGLGFTVVLDVLRLIRNPKTWRLTLHSKLVICTSLILLVFGTLIIYFLEHDNAYTLGRLPEGLKWLNAFFTSATTRTAGFNTIDINNMTQASLLVMMVLMFIGAGSSSTGGGIKVSTFAIAIIATRSFLQGKKTFHAFKRNIEQEAVLKSLAIIVVSFLTLITATFILMVTESAHFDIVLFESISAFSTVGLTAGLTANLTEPGKLLIIIMMIIGRLGPLTMAFALISAKPTHIRYANENVITG